MTGMEMMLQSIFRAMGLDPKQIMADMEKTVHALKNGIESIDENMRVISMRLERLERHLGVESDKTEAEEIVSIPPKRIGLQ